jgi:hypothetical protein
MCNLFGDEEAIKRKLEVLHRFCEEVGRPPEHIVKTRHCLVLLAKSRREFVRRLASIQLENEAMKSMFLGGDEPTVANAIRNYLDLGLNGMTLSIVGGHEADSMASLGELLTNMFQ